MEKKSISHSPTALNRRITELSSAGIGSALTGDPSSLDVEVSTLPSPSDNPVVLALGVPSSKENGENSEIVAGNRAPGKQSIVCCQKEANSCPSKSVPVSETICDVLCENTQETEGGCILITGEGDRSIGAANEEISGFNFPEIRAIQSGGESGGVANGNAKQGATGLKVLGAASGKFSEKTSAGGEDLGCSLEIELIDDTAVIGISSIGKNKNKEREPLKAKKPRRRSRSAKKYSDENKHGSNLKVSPGKSTGYKRTEKVKKIVYSRKAMEVLRFTNVKGQRKLWKKVFDSFSPTIKTEYEELSSFGHQDKPSGFSWETNPAPSVLGMAGWRGGGRCLNYYMRGQKLPGFLWGSRKYV